MDLNHFLRFDIFDYSPSTNHATCQMMLTIRNILKLSLSFDVFKMIIYATRDIVEYLYSLTVLQGETLLV